ncbi:MAG: hypothetical protein NTV60_02795 [Candidatus Kaiserbacteria bacterium]|nr:hypothetical protein [Candidatus Kaiserbacteria bacterium]
MKKLPDVLKFGAGVFIIIFTFFAFLIFLLFFAKMPFNDLMFRQMYHSLTTDVKHPTDSRLVEYHDFFGSRYTDITECTYEVGEIRSSSLTPEDVLRSYNNDSTLLTGPVHTIIINRDTVLPLDNPAINWLVEFREKISKNDEHTYYLVYLYKPGMSGLGDIRCFD